MAGQTKPRVTVASLRAENEALRAELTTLRELYQRAQNEVGTRNADKPTDPAWLVERRAQMAKAKELAARSGSWTKV